MKYGRSLMKDVYDSDERALMWWYGCDGELRVINPPKKEQPMAEPGYRYHISEMRDLQLPSLHRKPRLIPSRHDDVWDRYELGEMTIDGYIEFTVDAVGHNAYVPKLGGLAEVDLDSVKWLGYIERVNHIYGTYGCGSQLRITLRPTGGPVFRSQQPVTKESLMKVFETIILSIDAQGTVTGIAQGVKLITALDAQAAKDATLVDYVVEHKLSGKDLAGFKVRTREFLA